MKLRPLHDRVIVKRLEEDKKSAGGIIIPDSATEKPVKGEILAVGPGKKDDNGKNIALDLKYSGSEVKVDGDDLLVMREDDVIAVFAK
jgi:chaperonin GroES